MHNLPQYHFPVRARFGRLVPKTRIYEKIRAGHRLKQQFITQVDKLIWEYKLAPETINLPAAGSIKEIQVFDVYLKEGISDLDEGILEAVDKAIPHPIYYRIFREKRVKCAMTWKRLHEGNRRKWVNGDYYRSNWRLASRLEKLPSKLPMALDLAGLAESLIRRLITEPAVKGESLEQQLDRMTRLKMLQMQASRLQANVKRERQFNRKVELHGELKRLQQDIEKLRGDQHG
ncbi:MAG: DUF4391 domain-containing protein [Pseudohongiellaceae bacterium]